jgi:hypothetical protein
LGEHALGQLRQIRCKKLEAVYGLLGDIHFDRNTITPQNRKAGKAMAERPIPEEIMKELVNHVSALTDGHESLFTDRFSPKKKRDSSPFVTHRYIYSPLLTWGGTGALTLIWGRLVQYQSACWPSALT